MSRPWWRWGRRFAAAALLGALVWRLGMGPFVEGLRVVDARAIAAAVGITMVTTVCSAWRWQLVSRGLGATISLRDAVPAYYSSQFLNTVLPGGVLGDVHRGIGHGRAVGDVGRGVRAVAWERSAGQAVQITLTVAVLLAMPSPARPLAAVAALGVLAAGTAVLLLGRLQSGTEPGRVRRLVDAVAADLRAGFLTGRAWVGIVLASAVVVAGHTATLLVAMRVAGSAESLSRLLPLALLMLLAMSVPMSIAGMGPREGAAAWTFGAAGLGAAQGVTVAVGYGVMAAAATLPGAAMLLLARRRGRWQVSTALPPAGAATGAAVLGGARHA
jgi:glycosyltransferase 2 family protein